MNKYFTKRKGIPCHSEAKPKNLKYFENTCEESKPSRSFVALWAPQDDNGKMGALFRMTLTGIALFGLLFQPNICAAQSSSEPSFTKGETIIYAIKKLKMSVGKATLTFNGPVTINGKEALEVILFSKGFNFFDEEKIYLDPITFFPIVIKRDINIFGRKEKIDEFYDPLRGKVRIIKTAKGETTEETIENGERFDNIYGFIYRYRQRGQFKIGEEFRLHLPTRDVSFKLVEKVNVKVAGQEFEAYYMNSLSGDYKVWFDSRSAKAPLMIDGAIGFGHTSMIMKSYQKGK